ncbi:MAG: hypothetical protein Q7V05_03580 [Methanoregula sp.]|nr:hypothetical protein [Methanoregula sp.]
MVKTLFFLEDSEKIDQIVHDSVKFTGQSVYISLSPSASYSFERSNIPYKSVRDYGGGEERYQQGMENFERIDRIVTILDKELAYLHNIPTLTPARYSIYNLKILFDVLWNTIFILKTIIDTEQPDFIRLYAPHQGKSEERIYAFSNDESVYAKVLSMDGWITPIEIIQESDPDRPDQQIMGKKNSSISQFLTWIKERDLLFNLGLIGKRQGLVSIVKALYYFVASWHRRPVLIYNSGYNWDDSLLELHRIGMVPVFRIRDKTFDKDISKNNNYQKEVQKVCKAHPGMREFDQILGIGVSAFFFERLSQIIGRSIQESIAVYPLTSKIIFQKKICCLLHSVRERAIGHAIVQAAQDAGIPVVSWQHGGAGYCYHPMMSFIEFINSDWHFVFGESVAVSYRTTSKRIGLKKTPTFVPVGSSSLDTFQRNEKKSAIKQANKPVVYISTQYLQNIYFMSQPYDPVDWDEHLWDIQRQILNLAKKNPDKEFIIKLHSIHKNKEPLLSYVTDHGIKNVKIITSEMTVRELTDIADVVIFDLISTGILQVLTLNLPIFVYTGLHVIDDEIVLQLKKRGYIYENTGELIHALNEYIHTRKVTDYTIDTTNGDFIFRYGTDIHNYRSAERAVKVLNEIIRPR